MAGAQRLVRKICPNCKEEYELSGEVLDKLKMKASKGKVKIYKGKGCDKCFRSGYKGRVGLIETLVLTPKIKSLILENAQEHTIREEARREGMKTLRETGMQNVFEGITTVDEILRVTVGDQDMEAV